MEGIALMYQAKILLNEGYSRQRIAEILNVSVRTVYNYEHDLVFDSGAPRGRPAGKGKLSAFHGFIDAELEKDFTANAELLFQKLCDRGYNGKITILRDYISKKRFELHNSAVRRFETLPGQQAQIDWMYAGYVSLNGKKVKRYAFIMKLGYSRRSYIEFTTSMEQGVLFSCMIHAFEHFGGIPNEILFDNMKTAFIYNLSNCCWEVNVKMAAFAAHYGFTPRRCRAYRPKTKGKVEREVRYVRTSFLPSVGGDLSLVPTARLNELVELWMERVDVKVIRDFGQTRMERFADESSHLHTIPAEHFEYRHPEPIVVNREGRILFQTNRYSMPAQYRGKQLEGLLDPTDNTLALKHDGAIVRTIKLSPAGMKKTVDDPVDRKEHLDAWLEGFKLEEKIRQQALDKRKRAEQENQTADPAIFDRLFQEENQEVAV
ncbi:MAG: IS21 family transposase [Smithella sp.]|nr:IS21 family transposase [Smithella sp.]